MSSTRRGRGFTLIELLLAVAISAFLLTVSYAFFSAVERTGKAALENSKLQSLVSPLFYLFLKDFESINKRYGKVAVIKDTEGKLKWIEFYTANCYYFPSICKVKYWVYRNRNGKEHWLMRSEYRINSLGETGIDAPVSSKITSLKVYHLSGGEWVEGFGGKLVKIVARVEGGWELPLIFVVRTGTSG